MITGTKGKLNKNTVDGSEIRLTSWGWLLKKNYKVLAPSQVIAGFLNHQRYDKGDQLNLEISKSWVSLRIREGQVPGLWHESVVFFCEPL